MIVKDGCVIGRGTLDDKGPAVLTLYIAKFFKERGEQLPYTPVSYTHLFVAASSTATIRQTPVSTKMGFNVSFICASLPPAAFAV